MPITKQFNKKPRSTKIEKVRYKTKGKDSPDSTRISNKEMQTILICQIRGSYGDEIDCENDVDNIMMNCKPKETKDGLLVTDPQLLQLHHPIIKK